MAGLFSHLIVILLLFPPQYLCPMQDMKYTHNALRLIFGLIFSGFDDVEQQSVLAEDQVPDDGSRIELRFWGDGATVRHGR